MSLVVVVVVVIIVDLILLVNMSSGENRTKIELPKLDWAYDALEPHISGKINEIHHKKHHQTYVNGYNAAIESLFAAEAKGDVKAAIAIQQNIKFHGGGHTNHVLFWKTLAPPSQGGGKIPSPDSPLGKQIKEQYGSVENLISITNAKLACWYPRFRLGLPRKEHSEWKHFGCCHYLQPRHPLGSLGPIACY